MIRTTHAELAMLRRGATRVLEVPPRRPASGARKGKPPVVEGRVYRVFAPALWKPGPPRELDRARAEMRVLVLSATDEGSRWLVTVRGGYGVETPMFLAASPGTQRADYVPSPSRALDGEGEVLDPVIAERYAAEAKIAASLRKAERIAEAREAAETMPLPDRVRLLEENRGLADVTSELRLIEHRVARAEAEGLPEQPSGG